jgi:serine/threonine-protein kinase
MHYLASDQVPKLAEHAKDVHPLLLAACDKALATDPEQRFASAAEFRAALDGYLATLPQRPDARAFGATVAEAFAEERAKIRGVIERQLTQGPMLATGEISSMGLPQLPTPELSGASGVTAAASPQALTPVPMNTGTGLSMSSAVVAAPEPARSRNWPLVLAIVALAAGVVTLAVVILTRLPPPKEGTSAGGGSTAAPLPSVPAVPSSSAEGPKQEPAGAASVAPSALASTKGPKWAPPPKPSATATAVPTPKPPDIHLNR